MRTTKAVTIIQPFAELIARGDKRVENRTWPTDYRGRVFIHAGKSMRYGPDHAFDLAEQYEIPRGDLKFGAIIAVADLTACVRVMAGSDRDESINRIVEKHGSQFEWLRTHEHAEGAWCWVLENVRRLPFPLAYQGQLGLWTPNPETIARVDKQLAEASAAANELAVA